MDVLVCLARRGGEVVSRDELVAAVWGEDAFVSENIVSQSISRLRKALDDDWREPRFIETISRTGYRLKVPVTDDDTVVSEASVPAAGVQAAPRRSRVAFVVGLLGTVVLLVLTAAAIRSRSKLFSPAGGWKPGRPLRTTFSIFPRRSQLTSSP